MRRSSVCIADASVMFRAGFRRVLARDGTFEVREAGSLDELVDTAQAAPLDLALVDVALPPLGGVAAVGRLARVSDARIVMWSYEPSAEDLHDAVSAGALGFLCKTISPDDLLAALRRVQVGEAALAPDLVGLLMAGVRAARRAQEARAALLSARERRVLELVADGLRNRDIAAALGISEFTVKRHVQNLLRKLELPSRRTAAALYGAALQDLRDRAA